MKNKLISIFAVILLISITIPVVGEKNYCIDEQTQGHFFIIYMFIWGKVENITEESLNGYPYYNFTAVNVRYFWLRFIFPIPFWLDFERRRVWNQDGFLISKNLFHGIIGEGYIFGVVLNGGWEDNN